MFAQEVKKAPPAHDPLNPAKSPLRSVDRDIALLQRLVPWYVRSEHTLPCTLSAQPLAWDESFLGSPTKAKIEYLHKMCGRFVINPRYQNALPRGTETRYTPFEAGRVFHCGKITKGETSYLLVAKGVGATGFIRDDHGQCLRPGANYLDRKECRTVSSSSYSCRGGLGLLSEEFAICEFETSGMLRRNGVPAEAVVAVFAIERIPCADGSLAPLAYLHRIGAVHPNIMPVILIRAVETNIRCTDLKNLLLRGYRKEALQILRSRPHLKTQMNIAQRRGEGRTVGRDQNRLQEHVSEAEGWPAADLTIAGNIIDTELPPGTRQAMRHPDELVRFWTARRERALLRLHGAFESAAERCGSRK